MAEKKKSNSGIMIVIVLVVIAVGAIVYANISEMTRKSSPGIVGNTAGNLYNYGMFCDDGDRIYFSNYLDQGLLYSMSKNFDDFKFVTNDVVRYINHDDHYIYYSRMNNLKDKAARSVFVFYSNGVFRISKDGLHQKMLWNEPIGSLLYYDGNVFYQYYKEGEKISIHMTDIDGKEDIPLESDESVAVSVYNSRIYYGGVSRDRALYSINPSFHITTKELEGSFYNPVVIAGRVYYIDISDKYKIKTCMLDGGGTETLVNATCSAYNQSSNGRYLFYQVDNNSDDNGLYMLDRNSGESTLISQGNYKWINIIGNYCFFYESNESAVYCYQIGGGLSLFNPPVLSKK